MSFLDSFRVFVRGVLPARPPGRQDELSECRSDCERLRELNLVLARRFAALFEFSSEALLLVDPRGVIAQASGEAGAMFGASREQLAGRPLGELLAADARPEGLRLHERALALAASSDAATAPATDWTALRGLRGDGGEFALDMRLRALGAGGEPLLVVALRDGGERMRVDAEERRKEALYRYNLDNMLEGCHVIGFDWRYLYVNDAGVRHSRRSRDALIGRTMMEVYPGFEKGPLYALLRRCMDERVAQYKETEVFYPEGSVGWLELNVLPTPEGITMFTLDITARKRIEDDVRGLNVALERRVAERTAELVRAREAAETATRAKSAFLATMSHEIRTPMNGVVGMIEVLARTPLSEDQADAVRTIRSSAFALLGVIDDILDFSKIEAGRLELERAPVALAELVEGVALLLSSTAAEKGVDMNVFVDPRLPQQVWSDPTRLRQVLINLAGNAIKFSAGRPQRRGRVSVRAEPADGTPPRLVVRVADNGIGMEAQTLERLFTSFTQAEASTTRRFGGTGLGLAISKRLVTLMNGELQVESRFGEGSVFTVVLPIEEVEGGSRRVDPDLGGLDCIVVGCDVDPDDLRAYLEHAGARVHLAADPDEAGQLGRGIEQPVLIHNTRGEIPPPHALQDEFAGLPDARHLPIVRGPRLPSVATDGSQPPALDANRLRRSNLLRAVAVAAGRSVPETACDGDEDPLLPVVPATPPGVAEARAQGRLILVAEDNPVNQVVIRRQLEVLGFAAEMADNGVEALRLWRTGRYALLLTDLHMPDMDGYALAEAVRREEAQRGTAPEWRIPILAFTANALKDEAQRAQRAGMDGYLIKPLPLHLLRAALLKWLARDRGEPADVAPRDRAAPAAAAQPPVDMQVLRSLVGDDPAKLRASLVDLRATAGRAAAELHAAAAGDDLERVGAIARRLEASSRAMGASSLGDLCADIGNACLAGTRDGLAQAIERFDAALAAVDDRIGEFLARD